MGLDPGWRKREAEPFFQEEEKLAGKN